jgi:hypothetical protein
MKNSKLLIGSVVYGAAGIGCKVLGVEGDTLTVETPKGTRTIPLSKVVKVENPDPEIVEVIPTRKSLREFLKVGDRVYIPACDKFGTIDRISHKEGKDGLFARVNRTDGITRDILVECLEVAQ